MVVKTRSQYNKQQPNEVKKQDKQDKQEKKYAKQQQNNNEVVDLQITANTDADSGSRRQVRLMTSSLLEASKRTYKVYSPVDTPRSSSSKKSKSRRGKTVMADEAATEAEVAEAAEALLMLQEQPDDDSEHENQELDTSDGTHSCSVSLSRNSHICMNPMHPVTKYVYRIGIYNINQTVHYKTAYILYNTKTRMFHIYTIISNKLPTDDTSASTATEEKTEYVFTLPLPQNTIQTKYTTYIDDIVHNYVMTMIIPSAEHDYYIQDDILGIVIPNNEFQDKVFGEESSYYDVDDIVYDDTSRETTNGYKAFMLVPSRNYWYSPAGSYYTTMTTTTECPDNKYTAVTIDSVLMILSQSS
jgi:hypothetical protein